MAENPDPTRIVADVGVLAADLCRDGPSRSALDLIRSHSWLTLIVSEPLVGETEAVVGSLTDETLATEWRQKAETLGTCVEHPEGDHPALACASHGNAAHVLTHDESLLTASAGSAIKERVECSFKRPDAFAELLSPAPFYEAVVGGSYDGPDRDPRE